MHIHSFRFSNFTIGSNKALHHFDYTQLLMHLKIGRFLSTISRIILNYFIRVYIYIERKSKQKKNSHIIEKKENY